MELGYWKWVVLPSNLLFLFFFFEIVKFCISKWINVKCLEIEIKAVRLSPRFCLYGEN